MEPLFSIGHSNQALETFLVLLDAHAIDVLADVRSAPYSKYVTHFNANELKATIVGRGRRYVYLGRELEGRPTGDEYYDSDGHVLYSRVAQAPFFQDGIARLVRGMSQHRIAIMCSEEDPADCHRHLLIGRVLAERGITLQHIRGDGVVQTDTELADRAGPGRAGVQLSFLPGVEVDPWRSIRSVSRNDPRATSSNP